MKRAKARTTNGLLDGSGWPLLRRALLPCMSFLFDISIFLAPARLAARSIFALGGRHVRSSACLSMPALRPVLPSPRSGHREGYLAVGDPVQRRHSSARFRARWLHLSSGPAGGVPMSISSPVQSRRGLHLSDSQHQAAGVRRVPIVTASGRTRALPGCGKMN